MKINYTGNSDELLSVAKYLDSIIIQTLMYHTKENPAFFDVYERGTESGGLESLIQVEAYYEGSGNLTIESERKR